jgi:hypothetical protein
METKPERRMLVTATGFIGSASRRSSAAPTLTPAIVLISAAGLTLSGVRIVGD